MDIEMKPKKFMPGQAVTKNKNKPFKTVSGVDVDADPKFGDIVHVSRYGLFYDGKWYICLSEFSSKIGFCEDDFDPVITTHELESELSEIETGVAV